ncbi:peptidylprolyl isomerase [bacterium]|nr:peptidylprolyl isomerase [bacterium]
MAKTTTPKDDDETTPRKKSRAASSVFVWLMLGMIVTGLGGYGVTNFGHSVDNVATVGKAEISTTEYARALRTQINQLSKQFGTPLTLKQAQMFGLDQQVLRGLISNAALDNEAMRIGLSAGNVQVAQKIAAIPAFKDVTGKFDRKLYGDLLQQNGITVKEFETGMRGDLARQVLQTAIAGGVVTPQPLTDTVYAYQAETRGFTLLQLTEASLPQKLPAPSEDQLQAYYTAHIADFTRPEAKRVSYALLRPADIAKDQPVAEADIKAAYDAAADTYNVPEKRLVERLVFPSEAEAKAAKAKLDAGTSFEDLVKARGLSLSDIDMGDVTEAKLGAAGKDVFALTAPGVVGPLPSDLGPALYRMNAILPAQVTSLAEAHDKIKADLQLKAAAKAIADKNEALNDLLAGGSTVADIAKDQGMTPGTTDYAKGADDNDPVTADPAFVKAVDGMQPGDFAQAVPLSDGGLIVLQVTETVPPTPVPLAKAHDKVAAAYHADALAKALTALADADLAAVKGGAALGSLGITDHVASTRRNATLNTIPPEAIAKAFTMKTGEVAKIDEKGLVGLIRLDQITPADMTGDKAKAAQDQLATQAAQSIAQDAYDLFSTAMTAQGGLTIDQAAITAVQSRMN